MNEGIKITELPYTDISKDTDLIPIVQDGITKTTKKQNLAGKDGMSPIVSIGTVETLPAGSYAVVERDGEDPNVILSFQIPKGDIGATPNIQIGKVEASAPGATPQVTRREGSPDEAPILDFIFPRGETGFTPQIEIGTVNTISPIENAQATITGDAENPIFNFQIPRGKTPQINIGDVEVLTYDQNPYVQIVEDITNYLEDITLNFGIPRGYTGLVPNLQVGTVTTSNPGTSASVTRVADSTNENPKFNFQIPRGDKGETGEIPVFTVKQVTTVASDENASVTIDSSQKESPKISFNIPRGVMPAITLQATVLEPGQESRIYMEGEGTDAPVLHVELAQGPKGDEVVWEEYL